MSFKNTTIIFILIYTLFFVQLPVFAIELSSIPIMSENIDIWDGSIAPNYENGNGTKDNPYIIKTAEQLALLAHTVNAGETYYEHYFLLENDLNLNNLEWTPIGFGQKQFCGTFDGNNNTIFNLCITQAKLVPIVGNEWHNYESNIGLFGTLGRNGGVIKNTSVTGNIKIIMENTNPKENMCVGGICGMVRGYVENCHNYCDIYVLNDGLESYVCVGGICGKFSNGENKIYISKCSNHGELTGLSLDISRVAGVCGDNNGEGCVINSWNLGDVYAKTLSNEPVNSHNNWAGGIVAHTYDSYIINCYNHGNIYSEKGRAGGISGYKTGNGTDLYSNCYSTGKITGKDVGAIVGAMNTGILVNCFYPLNSNIVGVKNEGVITDCYEINDNLTINSMNNTMVLSQTLNTFVNNNLSKINLCAWENTTKDFPTLIISDSTITSLEMQPGYLELQEGASMQLNVIQDSTTSLNTSFIWSSENSNIASISNNGKVTARSEGTTIISATMPECGYTVYCNVKVDDDVLFELRLLFNIFKNYFVK